MQIVGPMPVGPVRPVTPSLELKPFQRVTADILQVNGNQILLSIDGVPVVADVLSSELAAELKGRPSAQFIVSQMEDGKTVLRLAAQPQSAPGSGGVSAELSQNLTLNLLREYGLPVTAETQTVAQAAINQRLPLQPAQMDQLMRTLSSLPGWGAREANLAAAILSAGLPLTPQSLELAARPAGLANETFASLLGQLKIVLQEADLPPEFRELVQTVTQTLQESVLDAGAPAKLNEKLAQAVNLLGRPLENILAEDALKSNGAAAGSDLAPQARTQPEPSRTGSQDLVRQFGQLQTVLQGSGLAPELKDVLRLVTQTLQESLSIASAPANLAEKLTQGLNLSGQLRVNLPAEQDRLSGGPVSASPGLVPLADPQQQAARGANPTLARQFELVQNMLQNSSLSPEIKEMLRTVYQALLGSIVDADANAEPNALGRLLANPLAEQARLSGGIVSPGFDLPALANLQQEAARIGVQELTRQLGQVQTVLQNSALPPEIKEALQTVYRALLESVQNPSAESNALGPPLGNPLAEQARLSGGIVSPHSGLPVLANLAQEAARIGGQELARQLGQVQTVLQNSALPPEIKEMLQTVYQSLLESVQNASAGPSLADKLPQALYSFGRSLENLLTEEARQSNASSSGLASLASLQQEAGRTGKHELARVLDDFMHDLSKAQWQNIPSTAQGQREDWVEAALWMRLPNPEKGMENIPIRLRIDRPPEDRPQKIDADHAHIIVQVELPDQEVFQVKIGLNQRQVKAEVIVPDDTLRAVARQELPMLAENLREQGYLLGDTQVQVGAPDHFEKVPVMPARGADLMGVDLVA